MSQLFVSPDMGNLTVPGAYSVINVQAANAGVATSGVIMLMGEADAGPDFSLVEDITQNFFGPDELAKILATYKSGAIVDAFKVAVSASNDPNIQGAPSRIFVAKTNPSVKATLALSRAGLTNYASLGDLSYGELGNQINSTVSVNVSEAAPTASFTYIPSPVSATLNLSVNGQAVQALTISAKTSPEDLVGDVSVSASLNGLALSGLNTLSATGGINRNALTVSGDISAIHSGNSLTVTLATDTWANLPVIGDTMIIPAESDYDANADSVIIGAASANAGAYIVTGVTTNTVTATKLRNNVTGNLVSPVDVATPVAIVAVTDVLFYSPVVLKNSTGTDRGTVANGLVAKTVSGAVNGSVLTLTLQNGSVWSALPQAGDSLLIPDSAPSGIKAGGANAGWYKVVSATSSVANGGSVIVATRVSNGLPAAFSATALAAVTDIRVFKPSIDGVGKTLEISDGSGTENISLSLFTLVGGPVTFLSTAATPLLVKSASEYSVTLTNTRSYDNVTESLSVGGDVVLTLGYHGGGTAGLTATCTIANVSGTPTLTTAVSGGTGANLNINLTKYKTVKDLATFINSQTGYVCSVGSALFGQAALTYMDASSATQTILDKTTFSINSALKSQPGRVKRDGWAFYNKLSGSPLVMVNPTARVVGTSVPVPPDAGLPDPQPLAFLANGARGATTDAVVVAALAALEKVQGNFLCPLFSQDATKDYALGLTDVNSSYEIDNINAAARSHVLVMSQVKRRRNRQGFLAKKDSFQNVKLAASEIASPRCSLAFQDFKFTGANGAITQYPPHMGAVSAAGMQAAGLYRPIVHRLIATSGVLMADGSYSDQLLSNVEDALQSGLLPAERADTGGFRWVSDQTTYATDNNFVYNSIQAVYVADLIALTIARRLETAFVGQSLADLSAGVMMSYLSAIMSDLKRLKFITSSDDAPAGWKNGTIRIQGPAAQVSLEVKLAGALYFIPITTMISQVTQTASS